MSVGVDGGKREKKVLHGVGVYLHWHIHDENRIGDGIEHRVYGVGFITFFSWVLQWGEPPS